MPGPSAKKRIDAPVKLPLWIAAVLPGALIAHGAAYAFAGQSTAGSAHA